MRPDYLVPITDCEDFTRAPLARIENYRWETGYEPEAFAQLIYISGVGFCVRLEAKEKDPKRDCTFYNQPVYKDSCLEFFVNFAPSQPKYMNYEMNANGAFLAALRTDRKNKTPIHELTHDLPAVRAEIGEDRWSVTALFTDRFISELWGKNGFRPGDTFTGNFYKCGDETPQPHYGMWSPVELEKPDFHQPAFFGTFRLEG